MDGDVDADSNADGDSDVDPEATQQTIRTRATRIKHRELRRTFSRLSTRGSLDDDQRRIIEEMAAVIVDDILAAPERVLRESASDEETLRTAITLFDPGD